MKVFIYFSIITLIVATAVILLTHSYLKKNIETAVQGDIITSNMETFEITSSAFENGTSIPAKYTCDGENISPPLSIKNPPDGTKSLVLIVYDPDVSTELRADGNWDHWIVFNIPPEKIEIKEGNKIKEGVAGITSSGKIVYGGPCPPKEYAPTKHRYFFKLYALDSVLDLQAESLRIDIEAKMSGRVLDSTTLIGVYERK